MKGDPTLYRATISSADDVGEHTLLLKNVEREEDGGQWIPFTQRTPEATIDPNSMVAQTMLIAFDQLKFISFL